MAPARGVRRAAYRIFRGTADPGEVFILIEYASTSDAEAARDVLLGSGVLDRFADQSGPTVIEEAEATHP